MKNVDQKFPMTLSLTRRCFLQATVIGPAAGFFPSGLPASDRTSSDNDRLRVGIIGVGGHGPWDCTIRIASRPRGRRRTRKAARPG